MTSLGRMLFSPASRLLCVLILSQWKCLCSVLRPLHIPGRLPTQEESTLLYLPSPNVPRGGALLFEG